MLKNILNKGEGRAPAVKADMTRWSDIANFVKEVIDSFGRIDVLVNNVGGGIKFADFEEYSVDEIDAGIVINLHSVIYACRAVVPIMKEQGSGHTFRVDVWDMDLISLE